MALGSGKPVIPVLVAGCDNADRPHPLPLRPLARLHAITLEDEGWRDGLARLRHCARALAGGATSRLAAGACGFAVFVPPARLSPSAHWLAAPAAPALAGSWRADVSYDWGDTHAEINQVRASGGRWEGTASHSASCMM